MAKHNNRLILVTGATGQQGGAVLRCLREKGFPVRAMTRNPDTLKARNLVGRGTEVVRGDMNDPATLDRVFDGAYGVYSVQTPAEAGVEAEIRQGINVADAARRARVSHLIYSSVAGADQKTGIPHFDSKVRIEEHLRNTGVPYTILRPVFFMENLLRMRDQIEQGTLTLPLRPQTRLQLITVDDIGAIAAMAFEHPGHWQGRALELAADELSMSEIAEGLGRMVGHPVRYVQIPWDQFEQRMGREMTLMFRWFEEVGFHVDIAAVRQEYANVMAFERWLHSQFQPA